MLSEGLIEYRADQEADSEELRYIKVALFCCNLLTPLAVNIWQPVVALTTITTLNVCNCQLSLWSEYSMIMTIARDTCTDEASSSRSILAASLQTAATMYLVLNSEVDHYFKPPRPGLKTHTKDEWATMAVDILKDVHDKTKLREDRGNSGSK